MRTRTGRNSEAGILVDLWLKEEHGSAPTPTPRMAGSCTTPATCRVCPRPGSIRPWKSIHAIGSLSPSWAWSMKVCTAPSGRLYERILEDNPQDKDISNRVNYLLASAPGRPRPD